MSINTIFMINDLIFYTILLLILLILVEFMINVFSHKENFNHMI